MNVPAPTPHPDLDEMHIAGLATYRELLAAKRRFLLPMSVFAVCFFLGLPLGLLFAPSWFSHPLLGALSPAILYAFALFAFVGIATVAYMRAAKGFDQRIFAVLHKLREERS